jgi:glucose/mannose transport system permease protein
MSKPCKLRRQPRSLAAKLALLPTSLAVAVCFYGCLIWTVVISVSKSKLMPNYGFSGLMNYRRLFASLRWETAYSNMFVFGALFILLSLMLGVVLAMLLDRNIKAEGIFRGIFLYPLSMSFIVTGLAWQWFLNPSLGLQQLVRGFGFSHFAFDWIVDQDRALYTVAIAAAWHAAGLVMALTLARLRGVDPHIWNATRIDGVHPLRVYWHVVLPMIRPAIFTSVVLLTEVVVKSYDIVIAMTGGGPGGATDLPSLFVVDFSFHRASLGVAAAGAVVMLASAIAALAPLLYLSRKPA